MDVREALALVQAVQAKADGVGRVDPADLLAALTALRELRDELALWEPQLITAAREKGVSWAGLAPALGVTSRQAAERRYLRLRSSVDDQQTGEQRVQAERAKRAGDRVVAAWARQNSGSLRRLAGQVSAIEGLSGAARHHVDVVNKALADDDPVALLSPLANTHPHLRSTHAALAEQIKSVTEQTERLRQNTYEQRA